MKLGLVQRAAFPLYKALETTVHPLRYLFLEVTQRCNLACKHCGSDCSRDTQRDELTLDEWLSVLDYLADRFDRRELFLVLTGGEPLCLPDLDVLLGRANSRGLRWSMVSNGFGLTQARAYELRSMGLESLTISLDGLESSHDWLRGRAGSYEKATAAIQHGIEAEVPVLDVVTCVHPGNIEELDSLMAVLRGLGVKAWRIFPIFPKGRALRHSELRLPDPRFGQLLGWISRRRAELTNQELSVDFCCEGYLPRRLDAEVRDQPYFCRAGVSIGSILCDGAIAACPNISRDLVRGNIRTDDFQTVWEERFAAFRDRDWMKVGPCSSCDQWKRCQGNSLHLWDPELGHTAYCHYRAVTGPE